ncbi:MAG: hypothetical protein HYY67_03380 [Thaumarchaeota archaeon]|nr:hypothetical protein [Nitrososphaerota archaeon]
MVKEAPANIEEYKRWLRATFGVKITDQTETYYQSVANKVKADFEESSLWRAITGQLEKFDGEYLAKTGYRLLLSQETPKLSIKPFNSFLLKTYRKNVLENSDWPSPPKEGWLRPEEWYSRINDIIRTTLVVKYLDGVTFITDKIQKLCEKSGLTSSVDLEARMEGYYAAHAYARREFTIPRPDWDTTRMSVTIEIQVTTQLQEAIRKLLHKYYDSRRRKVQKESIQWQWNYRSDEFATNYLGHILHYVEGMIMDIREKQRSL